MHISFPLKNTTEVPAKSVRLNFNLTRTVVTGIHVEYELTNKSGTRILPLSVEVILPTALPAGETISAVIEFQGEKPDFWSTQWSSDAPDLLPAPPFAENEDAQIQEFEDLQETAIQADEASAAHSEAANSTRQAEEKGESHDFHAD